MIRRKRKINKLRGTRTVGGGNTKNRRGKGNRMGRGSVKSRGGGTRNFMHIRKYEPERLHQPGFNSLRKRLKAITLTTIESLAKGAKELDVTKYGYQKVIATGNLSKPIIIKALKFSEKAIQKIEAAGGKAQPIFEDEQTPQMSPSGNQ